jgi:phosphate-selective porin OprO/OprP
MSPSSSKIIRGSTWTTVASALLVSLFHPSAARAQADAAPAESAQVAEPAPTLESVDEKVRILERKLELKEEDEDKKKSETPVVTAGKDGFSIASPDKENVLKLKYFHHIDGRAYFEDDAKKLPNTLLPRRVRPILEGTFAKYYNVRFQPEFAGTIQLLDAYGEIAYIPEARLRIGKSKTPIGLERIKSSENMDLIEFAHPTSLTPNYDLGISLLGDLWEESLSYYFGVFNGAVDGTSRDVDINDDKDLDGRVFAQPFKTGSIEILRGLGIGFSGSYGYKSGDSVNTDLPTYKTEGQQTFFSFRTVATKAPAVTYNATTKVTGLSAAVSSDTGTVRANGNGYRLNPQGYWYVGPFGLFGEYVYSAQDYSKGGVNSGKTEVGNYAWNATAQWVVTGEAQSFKGLKPRHPVSFKDPAGFGAFEVVGRYSGLRVDDDAFPNLVDPAKSAKAATTWSGGFNWYLSRNAKLSAEYAWTEFEGGAANGADRAEEKVLLARLQNSF